MEVILDSSFLNLATATVTRLIVENKNRNGKVINQTDNYFFEDCQIGQYSEVTPNTFFIKLKYSKEVKISNSLALFDLMTKKALSLISGIFAIWRVFKWFLLMRYQNRQARMVEEFEESHLV